MGQRIFVLLVTAWACFLGDGGGWRGCAWAIKLTNMTAPAVQDPRQPMHLVCLFDMDGEELYAVKWYKDDHEFYRYEPHQGHKVYQLEGLHVDERRSQCDRRACDLYLVGLARPRSSGAYRCEVSSEAPAFRLASQTHNVTVATVPTDPPVIEGLKDSYVVGDFLLINCTSGFGDPKPTLKWYINNIQQKTKVRELTPLTQPDPSSGINLTRAASQLRLTLDKSLIPSPLAPASLEVHCESSVEGINPAVAPPQHTRRSVALVDRAHLVNNQKLHWPNGAARRDSISGVVGVAVVAAVGVLC